MVSYCFRVQNEPHCGPPGSWVIWKLQGGVYPHPNKRIPPGDALRGWEVSNEESQTQQLRTSLVLLSGLGGRCSGKAGLCDSLPGWNSSPLQTQSRLPSWPLQCTPGAVGRVTGHLEPHSPENNPRRAGERCVPFFHPCWVPFCSVLCVLFMTDSRRSSTDPTSQQKEQQSHGTLFYNHKEMAPGQPCLRTRIPGTSLLYESLLNLEE